ncbi:hypothetical protein FRB96_006147 [Tulasnella sp. 330]|nr:hypothetical protein FRB96_006147 [Tulasnella sp. 330]
MSSSRRPATAPTSSSGPPTLRLMTQSQKLERHLWPTGDDQDQRPLQDVARDTDDLPSSPISFADWQWNKDGLHSFLSVETDPESLTSRFLPHVYGLVQEPEQEVRSSPPRSSTAPVASSSLGVDPEGAHSPKPRRKSIFKRVFKDLTGTKDLDNARHNRPGVEKEVSTVSSAMEENYSSHWLIITDTSQKDNCRGTGKSKSDMSSKKYSTSVKSFRGDDDSRSQKSSSSAAAKKSDKTKQSVFDPYFKAFVGLKGEPIPPVPPISQRTRDTHGTSSLERPQTAQASLPSPAPLTYGRSRAGSLATTATHTDSNTLSDWTLSTPLTANSVLDPNDPLSLFPSPFRRSRSKRLPGVSKYDEGADRPRHAFTAPNTPAHSTPMSSGSTSPVNRRFERRPSDTSLSQTAGQLDSKVISRPLAASSSPQPGLFPPQSELATLQDLYLTLLAQQPTSQTQLQQPIIPPQLASNLDSIVAVAASCQDLLNTLTVGALATGSAFPLPPNIIPPTPSLSTTPIQDQASTSAKISTIQNQVSSLAERPTHSRKGSITRGTVGSSLAPSIGSPSALSPPPRHQQTRTKSPMKAGSESVVGQGDAEVQSPSSSPEQGEALWMEGVRRRTLQALAMAETKTPPVTSTKRPPARDRALESHMSFSSYRGSLVLPQSPIPITITPEEDSESVPLEKRPPLRSFPTASGLSGQHNLTPATSHVPLTSSSMATFNVSLQSDEEIQSSATSSTCSSPRSVQHDLVDEEETVMLNIRLMELLKADEEGENPLPGSVSASGSNTLRENTVLSFTASTPSLIAKRGRLAEEDYRTRALPPPPTTTHYMPKQHPSSTPPLSSDRSPAPSSPEKSSRSSSQQRAKGSSIKPSFISTKGLRSLDLDRHDTALPSPLSADSPFAPPPTRSSHASRPGATSYFPFVTDYGFPLPPSGVPSLSPRRRGGAATTVSTPEKSRGPAGYSIPREVRY